MGSIRIHVAAIGSSIQLLLEPKALKPENTYM